MHINHSLYFEKHDCSFELVEFNALKNIDKKERFFSLRNLKVKDLTINHS